MSDSPPYRPLQYLGAKGRAATPIAEAVARLAPPGSRVVDLFAGSTVVSQALAAVGFRVSAVDVQGYSGAFGRAFLGVGRPNHDRSSSLVHELHETAPQSPWLTAAREWVEKEDWACGNADADSLIDISRTVPQIWRRTTAKQLEPLFQQMETLVGQSAHSVPALLGTHYAGTYLGIRQAGELDRARSGIERMLSRGRIGPWEEALLLTGLIGALSDVVFSAGKHFAQPYQLSASKELTFARGRILRDRSIDVWESLAKHISRIERAASPDAGHEVLTTSMEELLARDKPILADVIYADPPYTAQQYSRFYHLPETVASYRVPELQTRDGNVTRGLYPTGRFKSRFCSKRQAPSAFRDLLALADRSGAHLVLSYSQSKSGSSGNDRMLNLDQTIEECMGQFGAGAVEVTELNFQYRQFNATEAAVAGRQDLEYLIACQRC